MIELFNFSTKERQKKMEAKKSVDVVVVILKYTIEAEMEAKKNVVVVIHFYRRLLL